jgi:hypothetical protein
MGLAAGSTIAYGGGGALDLSNVHEFVIPEPDVRSSAAEKRAIVPAGRGRHRTDFYRRRGQPASDIAGAARRVIPNRMVVGVVA